MTEPLRDRLRAGLTDAMRAQDRSTAAVLRVALAAIENAEAVPPGHAPAPIGDESFAGSTRGLGAGEGARRSLDEAEIASIVASEVDQLLAGAAEYEDIGRGDAATELRQQAATLDAYLVDPSA